MGSHILAAAPSWYCGRVSDCNERGVFVFGAKHSLYMVDVTCRPPQFVGNLQVHQERVVAVSLCSTEGQRHLCATSSEDGRVKVWDLENKKLLTEHQQHKAKPTAVHWCPCDPDLIASGDEHGELAIWRRCSNSIQQLSIENSHIFCLAFSPHSSALLAAGYKSGLVLLLDVSARGAVLQKFRGHDDEVHSVSWCPTLGEDVRQRKEAEANDSEFLDADSIDSGQDGNSSAGCLLASGSRDRTIRVWSTLKGKSLLTLKLPVNTGYRRERYDDQSKSRVWLTLYWPKGMPRHIVSSAHSGELLMWDLCRPGKQKWDYFRAGEAPRTHNRIVFNICAGGPDMEMLCTISMDRQIIFWDLPSLSGTTCLPVLGGFVYSLVQAPLNPECIAVGVGDNTLRVWHAGNPSNPFDCTSFWQGIKSKVTALSWHPTNERLLAYGTDDGRVGIYDILSTRTPLISNTYHKRTVYVVTWGPSSTTQESDKSYPSHSLYSCGDGVILQHNPDHMDVDAVDIAKLIQKTNNIQQDLPARSEISWKPGSSVVSVGSEDGSVEIFRTPTWQLLCTIQVSKKLMNVLRWHPEFTAESPDASSCHAWLASGGNESVVNVVDLSKALEHGPEARPLVVTESFCQLEGHTSRITGLAWNPHKEGQIASASYDGSAQIWDVRGGGTPLANFRGHPGRLFCIQWSVLDPDKVFTGGDDFCVHAWHISKQEYKIPPKAKVRRRGKGKTKGQAKPFALDVSNTSASPAGNSEVSPMPDQKLTESLTMATSSEIKNLELLLEQKRRQLEEKATVVNTSEAVFPVEATSATVPGPEVDQPSEETTKLIVPDNAVANGHAEDQLEDEEESVIKNQPTVRFTDMTKKGGKDKKRNRIKSMFPVSSQLDTSTKSLLQQDCMHLADHVYAGDEEKFLSPEQSHLGLYADRRNTYQLINTESAHHQEQGHTDQNMLLNVWKGNISGALQAAADSGHLNDWLMALAPCASPLRWRELCEIYAHQLEVNGHFHKAASYLLAAHQVDKAIQLLQNHGYFREALCLAKVRLPANDSRTTDLYMAWAERLTKDGHCEQAAKCYLAVKKPVEAARVVARRTDANALRTAAYITLKAAELDLSKSYVQKFVLECQLRCDWASAADVLKWHSAFKPLALVLSTHELISQELAALGLVEENSETQPSFTPDAEVPDPSDVLDKVPIFLLNPDDKDKLLPWEPHVVEKQAFIHAVIKRWLHQWKIVFDGPFLNKAYEEVSALRYAKQSQSSTKQVMVEACLDVVLGLLSLLLCQTDRAAKWWTAAMATCHDANQMGLLEGFVRLLLPQGPASLHLLQQQVVAARLAGTDNPAGLAHSRRTSICDNGDGEIPGFFTTSKFCFATDSLAAYCYLAVLNSLGKGLPKVEEGVADEKDSKGAEEQLLSKQFVPEIKAGTPETQTSLHTGQENGLDEEMSADDSCKLNVDEKVKHLDSDASQSKMPIENGEKSNITIEDSKDCNDISVGNLTSQICESAQDQDSDLEQAFSKVPKREVSASSLEQVLAASLESESLENSYDMVADRELERLPQGETKAVSITSISSPSDSEIGQSALKDGKDLFPGQEQPVDSNLAQGEGKIALETETPKELVVNDAKHSDQITCRHWSQDDLKHLSRTLLWDIHAHENKLKTTLKYIQRTLAIISAQQSMKLSSETSMNAQGNNEPAENDLDDIDSGVDLYHSRPPLSVILKPFRQRSMSGEYINMRPPKHGIMRRDCSRSASLTVVEGHLWANTTVSGSEDEYEEMNPPESLKVPVEGSQCANELPVQNGKLQMDSSVGLTQSGVLQTQIYQRAHSIFSDMSSSVVSENGDPSQGESSQDCKTMNGTSDSMAVSSSQPQIEQDEHCDMPSDGVVFSVNGIHVDHGAEKSEDLSTASTTSCLPENWADLPADVKYNAEYVSLKLLVQERDRVASELQTLSPLIQTCPFPDPLTSCKLLLETALPATAKDCEFLPLVCQWAIGHCCTTEEKKEFKIKLQNLTS